MSPQDKDTEQLRRKKTDGADKPKPKTKGKAAGRAKSAVSKGSKSKGKQASSDTQDAAKAGTAKKAKQKRPPKPVVPPANEPALLVVREVKDRFRMPEDDHALIKLLKKRAKKAGQPTRKSDLLRAGLHLLQALDPAQLIDALGRLGPRKSVGKPQTKSAGKD